MTSLETLLEKARQYEEDLISFLSGFVQIPSVNPPGDMSQAAAYVEEFLGKWGLPTRRIEPEKGVITIYSSVGDGEDYLMLNGHMDVVPEGDHDKWSIPPFSGRVVDGYLYGRGASDMKGGLSALIYAYAVFTQYVDSLDRKLSLAAVGDEEVGGRLGSLYMAKELGIRPRYVLLGEPSTLGYYNIGEKGIVWYRVHINGEPAHASVSPYVGRNAIKMATEVINRIYGLAEIDFDVPEELLEVARKSGEKARKMVGAEGLEKIFFRLSCNAGIINGGVKTNVVAPNCTVEFDMRIPHGLTVDKVIEMVRERLSDIEGVEIEKVAGEDPNYTRPDTYLGKVVEESAVAEAGIKPEPSLVMGATDGRHFRAYGSEAVVYGPGEWERIHGYDERIKVDDVKLAYRIYLRTLYKMLVG